MAFNHGLKIGQILKNADIVDIFKCQSPIETAILRPAELTNLSPIETANLNPIKEAITILLHVL